MCPGHTGHDARLLRCTGIGKARRVSTIQLAWLAEAEKLTARPWSELSWPDRLRCTRVLGPFAVATHCLFVKGLVFDGAPGLFYTAQRVAADVMLSMHLLRHDIEKSSR